MLNLNKTLEYVICFEVILISTFIPVYIFSPSPSNIFEISSLPLNYQIPLMIYITILFSERIVIRSFLMYLITGLFFLPVFFDGGYLEYLLTPNFGYLLGIFPLIKIISFLKKTKSNSLLIVLKFGFLSLLSMHIIGIIYLSFQSLLIGEIYLIPYYIGRYTLGKLPFQTLMLFPLFLIIRFKSIINSNE